MWRASAGGSALMVSYFHSCFLNTYESEDISDVMSSSLLFIWNSDAQDQWHSCINQSTWEAWTEALVQLSGGDSQGRGRITKNNTSKAADSKALLDSTKLNKMVPLSYDLWPITRGELSTQEKSLTRIKAFMRI